MPFNVMFGDDFPRDDVDEWCRSMWNALAEDGRWAIKRSGLIFAKQKGKLILVARMPHMVNMPITAEQLTKQQDADFKGTVEHFGRIGVIVEEQT